MSDICRYATFYPNSCTRFWVILLTDRQTDRHGRKHLPPPLSEVIIGECARISVLYWSWLLTGMKHRATSLRQQSYLLLLVKISYWNQRYKLRPRTHSFTLTRKSSFHDNNNLFYCFFSLFVCVDFCCTFCSVLSIILWWIKRYI